MVVIARKLLPRRARKYLVRGCTHNVIVKGDRLYHSPFVVEEPGVDENGMDAGTFYHMYCRWLDAGTRAKGECDGGFQKYFDPVRVGPAWRLRRHCLVCTEDDYDNYGYDAADSYGDPRIIDACNDSDHFKALYPQAWRALALCCPHPKFLGHSSKVYRFREGLSIKVITDGGIIERCRFFHGGDEVTLERFLRISLCVG